MPEPHLRAADADRAAVAGVLGEHMAAGRLSLDEYDERLARAYAAKTYGELSELTADLPSANLPEPARRATPEPTAAGSEVVRWGGHWGGSDWQTWLRTSLIVVAIWAATSLANWEFLYFWPIWVMGPWGAVLLAQSFGGDDDDEDDGPPRQLGR